MSLSSSSQKDISGSSSVASLAGQGVSLSMKRTPSDSTTAAGELKRQRAQAQVADPHWALEKQHVDSIINFLIRYTLCGFPFSSDGLVVELLLKCFMIGNFCFTYHQISLMAKKNFYREAVGLLPPFHLLPSLSPVPPSKNFSVCYDYVLSKFKWHLAIIFL